MGFSYRDGEHGHSTSQSSNLPPEESYLIQLLISTLGEKGFGFFFFLKNYIHFTDEETAWT